MTWCVSFWSSGSKCVAALTLSSRLVVMCIRYPMLTSNVVFLVLAGVIWRACQELASFYQGRI